MRRDRRKSVKNFNMLGRATVLLFGVVGLCLVGLPAAAGGASGGGGLTGINGTGMVTTVSSFSPAEIQRRGEITSIFLVEFGQRYFEIIAEDGLFVRAGLVIQAAETTKVYVVGGLLLAGASVPVAAAVGLAAAGVVVISWAYFELSVEDYKQQMQ